LKKDNKPFQSKSEDQGKKPRTAGSH
jgi:hypothetical protein